MRVCLITPPSPFLLDQRVFMSLGILKVAAALEREGFSVDHLDLSGIENPETAIADYLATRETTVFGFTATTPQVPVTIQLAKAIRFIRPESRLILGGPHVTLVNAAKKLEHRNGSAGRSSRALEELAQVFDCLVSGDGEAAIIPAINGGARMVDADDPASEFWLTSQKFTESAWPSRHLVDVHSYRYTVDGEPALSMVTQLGCPFECGFCGGRLSPMLRRIRTRPADSVISEMLYLHDVYGVRGMMFYDDELNVNKGIVGLMRGIKDTGIDWRLRGFVKAELFTEEQAEAMYAAGFRWLLCGFESAHPRILRNINKKATLADNTRMLRIARRFGLKVKALMSFGHPGESETTILATRDWLIQERPDDFDCTVITTYPGTPYFDRSEHVSDETYCYEIHGDKLFSRDIDYSREANYYKGKPGEYESFVWTEYLSAQRLVKLRDEVEHEVRSKLGIPYPSAASAITYEHSMGQNLPMTILRSA